MSEAYYHRVGPTTFEPTRHAQGAWRTDEQHMAPVSGLLLYAIETVHPRPDLVPARLGYDIFGMIGLATSEVTVTVVRPGRTIELTEATLAVGGRTAVRLGLWRLAPGDTTAVAGGPDGWAPLPPPATWPDWPIGEHWDGGFIDSLDVRRDPGSVPGRVRAWLRPRVALVSSDGVDEPVSDTVRLATVADSMNGIGARVDPTTWMFPNTDLSVHLLRRPRPVDGWVGFDVRAGFGASGLGLTEAVLHDAEGMAARAVQALTVRPLPPPASA